MAAVVERSAETLPVASPVRAKGTTVWGWLATTDHKVIGNLYFITTMGFFLFGGVLALAIRAELAFPRPAVPVVRDL
jgi:cytochrome c oxidase subunit 1